MTNGVFVRDGKRALCATIPRAREASGLAHARSTPAGVTGRGNPRAGKLSRSNNGPTVNLFSPLRLPILANHSFSISQAKRADLIWSEGDFLCLCEHMLNDNPLSHFLNVWRDKNGQARFTKAPHCRRADNTRAGLGPR